VAELVLEKLECRRARLARGDGQWPDQARERHQRRAVRIGLGLQRDRPSRRLDGVVVRRVPQLRDREPGLRRLEGTGQHLAEHGDVGEHLLALARHGLEAAEGRQRLGEPPLPGVLERRVELGPPRGVDLRRLEPHFRPQGGGHAGRADDRGQEPPLVLGAQAPVEDPLEDPLREAHVAELAGDLHERGRDADELGRHVLSPLGPSGGDRRGPGLVE
jgi:hypothetical protein